MKLEPQKVDVGSSMTIDEAERMLVKKVFTQYLGREATDLDLKKCVKLISMENPGYADLAYGSTILGGIKYNHSFNIPISISFVPKETERE